MPTEPPRIAWRTFPMNAGDTIFVPAGTAHTIGPGLLLCEIQQHSDLTYRVFDYNRPDAHGKMRPLHIEKALQVMRFGAQLGGKVDPVQRQAGRLDGNISRRVPLFRHREMGIERAHRRRHVARSTSIC